MPCTGSIVESLSAQQLYKGIDCFAVCIKIKPEGKGDFTLFGSLQIVQQLLHGYALVIIVSKVILYAINLKTIGMRLL